MKKPIIGISGSWIIETEYGFAGYKRAYVNDDYVQSVLRAGGIPLILPIVEDLAVIESYIEQIDGLIMSGGHDVNPILFNEEPSNKLGDILPERDAFDIALIKSCMKAKKPLLGICRGEQILNVANGGTLYQDLSFAPNSSIKHNQKTNYDFATHSVDIEKGSKLYEILGEEILVNSFHHLAVKDVAPDFKIVATSKDGIVEGIEKIGDEFIIGVQWHPEMLSKKYSNMAKLFERLVAEAKKGK